MRVLLTRPEGRNQAMSEQLQLRSIAHLITPMIEVISSNQPVDSHLLQQAEILIFVSTNAVEFAAKQLTNGFPQHCHYFAVGNATADLLESFGLAVTRAPSSSQDSEGLLSLTELQQVNQQNVLIVRGNGGRETIAEQLRLRGAHVSYWETYTRQRPQELDNHTCQQWVDFNIDTIVVTSGEILSNLVNLLPKELFAWFRSCHIIVPSTRVELQALELGLINVSNAQGANTQAILAQL
ncbi:uroporphyrinogen-III synthase [Shewanella maritima]|uniref:uroporphyrinogen-III synthase n=1 Tax=Shewanella maritima TaxID=2520507 RepID=UPI0037357F6C